MPCKFLPKGPKNGGPKAKAFTAKTDSFYRYQCSALSVYNYTIALLHFKALILYDLVTAAAVHTGIDMKLSSKVLKIFLWRFLFLSPV